MPFRPAPILLSPAQRRLRRYWLGGIGFLLFIMTFVVGNFFLPAERRLTQSMVGHDFLAFYTAGTFLREGRPHDLYDLQKVKAFQHELGERAHLELGKSYGPFWNPPFYAWIFVPLAALPYPSALLAWELINLACLCGAIALLMRMIAAPAKVAALVPLFIITSMPFIQATTHGQNTMVSLLLLCATVTFWRARRAVLAGSCAALLLYKPQLGAVVAIAIVLTLGWRALIGLIITSAALLCVNFVTLPGTLTDYLAQMPGNLREFQVLHPYLWDRHITLRAFWRLLWQGREAGEISTAARLCWLASAALLAGFVVRAWWQQPRASDRAAARDAFIAAVIAAMPLLMPFYFDYDLLLIAVSAVLYAARPQKTKWLTRAWIALYVWLMINSIVGRLTHVNGSVLLLACIAAMLTHRAAKIAAAAAASTDPSTESPTPPLAAAA
jgi:alpha-1,2-mannosyltransferase